MSDTTIAVNGCSVDLSDNPLRDVIGDDFMAMRCVVNFDLTIPEAGADERMARIIQYVTALEAVARKHNATSEVTAEFLSLDRRYNRNREVSA